MEREKMRGGEVGDVRGNEVGEAGEIRGNVSRVSRGNKREVKVD